MNLTYKYTSVRPAGLQVEVDAGLDCSSCHLNFLPDAMNAADLNADGPTIHDGHVRGLSGYRPSDIDLATGYPIPGAQKLTYLHNFRVADGTTVRAGWSLRMIVLSREPSCDHVKWMAANKADLVKQVLGSVDLFSISLFYISAHTQPFAVQHLR